MKRKKDSNEFINNSFVGKIVLSKYGNFKTYTIENIDFQKSPLDKFTC